MRIFPRPIVARRILYTYLCALAIFAGALLAASAARADDTLTLAGSLESGTCRDTYTGEADVTQTVSLEYRHESQDFSALGYARRAPSGGNCADAAFSFDGEIERRWGGRVYGLVRLGAEQTTATGAYRHVDGGLILFASRSDGSPAYTALLGVGRCWGDWCVEAGANLAPNDYRGHVGAQSGHVGLTYARELLGGDLDVALEVEGPALGTLITGQRVSWSRPLAEHVDLSLGWRRRGGLDEYLSPFAEQLVLDDRSYSLAGTDGAVSTLEVGVTARF